MVRLSEELTRQARNLQEARLYLGTLRHQRQGLTTTRIQQFRNRNNDEDLPQQQQGLTAARIQQFQQFPADELLAGDICSVCQYEIEVGSRMMRLDCDGQHVFCKDCVEGWFADHKTCPNCRHEF